MAVSRLSDLAEMAKRKKKKKIAVAAAHDEDVLRAVTGACRQGIADAVLVGDEKKIVEILERQSGKVAEGFTVIHAGSDLECAAKAVREVREGRAHFLMKGLLGTAALMREVVNRDTGIRGEGLLSHVMFFEQEKYPKLLCLTDGGMTTFPTLGQKAEILKNAARVMKRLGYGQIYAACVCGAENVNPKIVSTVDAAKLSEMREEWEPYNMEVYGPVGLDLAISMRSCEHKKYRAKGAGEADILLVPTYEVGNGIGKAMIYFGNARNAGIIVGAKAPIILVSRSDAMESKLASIALASIVAE